MILKECDILHFQIFAFHTFPHLKVAFMRENYVYISIEKRV